MKMIVPDASCSSSAPVEIGTYGVFPVPLDQSGLEEKEVRALIKAGVPFRIVTVTTDEEGSED